MESVISLRSGEVEITFADPLFQRHIEDFFRHSRELNDEIGDGLDSFTLNGNFVRAAIKSKVITEGISVKDVATWHPGEINLIADKIDTYMAWWTEIPKN